MIDRILFFSLLVLFIFPPVSAQSDKDAFDIREIYDLALTEGHAYEWLRDLTKNVGPRLSGSPGAAAAVEFGKQIFDTLGFDRVFLQECKVPNWDRGEKEIVRVVNSFTMGSVDLSGLALGFSGSTGPEGITGEVIQVFGLDGLKALSEEEVAGKIVFFNEPMDPKQINTFNAYSGAVSQRSSGPNEAAKKGAIAAIVRSMTTKHDDVPHTGGTSFEEGQTAIPAIAISTLDAELLGQLSEKEPVRVYIRATCRRLADQTSYNVVGEIRGSEFPDEIILIGGHLDSWDVAEGAHDDGAGCVQSMDVIRILKLKGYKPKRTIRCVLFMNEENGLAGGKKYAELSNEAGEFHLAAIESDRGGFSPRGFTTESDNENYTTYLIALKRWESILRPYGLEIKAGGGSGADIGPLKGQKGMLIGLLPDSQRYFDFHHAPTDVFEAVNERELQLGVAAMASLVFLIDSYGLE